MAWNPLENVPRQWQDPADNTVLDGYWLIAFEAGTTTRVNMAIDSSGSGSAAKFQTNSNGYLATTGGAIITPFVDQQVKLALVPTEAEADSSDTSNSIWPTIDNVSGIVTPTTASFATYVSNYAALRALTPGNYSVGDVVVVTDENIAGFFRVSSGTATDNGGTIITNATWNTASKHWVRVDQSHVTLEMFEVADAATFLTALTWSGTANKNLYGSASFTISSRIDLPAKFRLKADLDAVVITASGSYWSGSENFMIYGEAATNIADSFLEGIKVIGGLSSFNNDGIDRYGIYIEGCTNTSVRRCRAEDVERGIIIRNGATGGELAYCYATDCHNQGIGYIGTSADPITDVSLHHNFSQMSSHTSDSTSGIRTEEVYDSEIYENKATKHYVGIRIENSCDNVIRDNKGWECDSVGGQLYNFSHRNTVYGNRFWDNNYDGLNDVSLTPDGKGNANTGVSGFELQNSCNNNTVFGNISYNTTSPTIPFDSGSTEPTVGDTLSDATSGATGLLRRVEVTSGSWSGGDAAGLFHVINTTGTWGSANNIDNDTAPSTNIATENGSITTGSSTGQQRYGIGINIRNIQGADGRDAFNLVFGNQCFNNGLNAVEDRGFANDVFGNTEDNYHQTITRNA